MLSLLFFVFFLYCIAYYFSGRRLRYSPGQLLWHIGRRLIESIADLLAIAFGMVIDFFQGRSLVGRTIGAEGAYALNWLKRRKFLSKTNDGIVIDGRYLRLSIECSAKGLIICATTGAGKTTRFIIPNLLQLIGSAVVPDPSGECFEATSGYLAQNGVDVLELNLQDVSRSLRFNPVMRVRTVADIMQLAKVIVLATYINVSGDQAYWAKSAERVISIIIQALKSEPEEYQNLHNVYHLLNQFGDGKPLFPLFARQSDERLFGEFKGLISTSENALRGVISTAQTCLESFADPNLCRLTATDTIDFKALIEKPTVLFLIAPEHKISLNRVFLTLFWHSLLDFVMDLPVNRDTLPLYLLMDEFGNLGRLPDFATVMTTARKRRVSISLVLQQIDQLRSVYGQEDANVIMNGGCASRLFLPGLPHDDCLALERTLGRQTSFVGGRQVTQPLLSADEIRTLPDDRALFIHGNKRPVLLKTTPYFKDKRLSEMAQIPPVSPMEHGVDELKYLPLG